MPFRGEIMIEYILGRSEGYNKLHFSWFLSIRALLWRFQLGVSLP